VDDSNLICGHSHWIKNTLIKNNFTIDRGDISADETVIIDATESGN
jgi:hypothetical protein